jgi:transcriptional regulator with XRE-family HTH domain
VDFCVSINKSIAVTGDDHQALLASFGDAVRQVRKERNLSQEALADLADLDRTYISGTERGVRNPSLRSIARIATALDVSLEELFKPVKLEARRE